MPKPPKTALILSDFPIDSPAFRLVPGKSREQVARSLKISVAEVARIERLAMAKCYAEMLRRGQNFKDLISLISPPN